MFLYENYDEKITVKLIYFIYAGASVIERFFARVNVFCHERLTAFLFRYTDTAKCHLIIYIAI